MKVQPQNLMVNNCRCSLEDMNKYMKYLRLNLSHSLLYNFILWFGLVWLSCATTGTTLEPGDLFTEPLSPSLPLYPTDQIETHTFLVVHLHSCTALLPREAQIANMDAMPWSLISSVWPFLLFSDCQAYHTSHLAQLTANNPL